MTRSLRGSDSTPCWHKSCCWISGVRLDHQGRVRRDSRLDPDGVRPIPEPASAGSRTGHIRLEFEHPPRLHEIPTPQRATPSCLHGLELRSIGTDPLAVNEHTDKESDQRVLATLSSLSDELRPLCQELGGRFVRFRGYQNRFAAALARVEQGDHSWVAAQEWTRATRYGWNCMRIW